MIEKEYKLKWISSTQINKKHLYFKVTQVSCWVISSDQKVLLVSKDNVKWTVTAGHTEIYDADLTATAIREVYEEAGLDISTCRDKIKMLGYYIVEVLDKKTHLHIETCIQARFVLFINELSNNTFLVPHEKNDQIEKVKYARFFSIKDAERTVIWFKDSGDFNQIKKMLTLS